MLWLVASICMGLYTDFHQLWSSSSLNMHESVQIFIAGETARASWVLRRCHTMKRLHAMLRANVAINVTAICNNACAQHCRSRINFYFWNVAGNIACNPCKACHTKQFCHCMQRCMQCFIVRQRFKFEDQNLQALTCINIWPGRLGNHWLRKT